MNMHGFITPVEQSKGRHRQGLVERIREWVMARRMFMGIVVLPTLLVAGYLYLIASNQYESEAHFMVRNVGGSQMMATSGLSQALSLVTGDGGGGHNEAMSVSDYLTSHDVVDTLRKEDDLVGRFHRSGVDLFSRMRFANPTPEKLLKYYRKQVKVRLDSETGITTMTVHSFTPQDSYELNRKLLELGERRVNELNERSYNDAISMSRRQLREAEGALEEVQLQMTKFRQSRRDIDPEISGRAQIGLVSTLTGELAAARAQLNAMGGMIDHSSPQYRALAGRVAALEGQVAAQSGRLTGDGRTIANNLSGYQALQLRQEFLAKRYEASAASFEKAREEARRQQLYIVRVVNPNMPVKSLFPERGRIVGTVLVALLLIYSIGWLIAAGVKEHAA